MGEYVDRVVALSRGVRIFIPPHVRDGYRVRGYYKTIRSESDMTQEERTAIRKDLTALHAARAQLQKLPDGGAPRSAATDEMYVPPHIDSSGVSVPGQTVGEYRKHSMPRARAMLEEEATSRGFTWDASDQRFSKRGINVGVSEMTDPDGLRPVPVFDVKWAPDPSPGAFGAYETFQTATEAFDFAEAQMPSKLDRLRERWLS